MTDSLAATLSLVLEAVLLCGLLLAAPALALRRPMRPRGVVEPAIALHRAQRAAIERDRAAGLLGEAEHREAGLEIDRRLLADGRADDTDAAGTIAPFGRRGAILLLLPVAVLAGLLYSVGGHPTLPAAPLRNRIAAGQAEQGRDAQLVATLHDALSQQDPDAPRTRQGYLLLAQTEASLGHWAEAASAWRTALAHGFEPVIAVEAAEAQCRADNGVSADSAALFRRALDAAGQDAPWRGLAEQRLAQFEHARDPH